jgi:hypothetical protein
MVTECSADKAGNISNQHHFSGNEDFGYNLAC